jgi:DNA-binding XRE family transcriptional regulator
VEFHEEFALGFIGFSEPVRQRIISMSELLKTFGPQLGRPQLRRIEQMTAELIAEEMTLRELRLHCKLTQARLAKKLKIGQEGVSRIERRSDINLSTLNSFVRAVGGTLRIEAGFPDQPPFVLTDQG